MLLPLGGVVRAQNNVDVLNPVCVDQKGRPLPADRRPEICTSGQNMSDEDDRNSPITGKNGILIKVIDILSLIVGVACVLVIIISGLRFIVSAGDSNAISSARRSLIYAVVGLLIVIISRALVLFILSIMF